ncbi:MAG: hypothetical protein KOO62_01410 [candidate division Zixibacteria bacterium]|nr:hypothetical protein [candidate division Zixibacteria bacterium]
MNTWRVLKREERGATTVMVAFAMVMILGFAVVAIDMSIVMLAKNQLQIAADAAALAGALSMGYTNGDQGAAESSAIEVAGLNVAIQDVNQPVIIGPDDVTFPESNKITVVTHRKIETGDPISLHFINVLDDSYNKQGEMTARASAAVYPVSGTDCIKPWCFPDQWDDTNNDSLYDPGEFYDPLLTGYVVPDDVGTQIVLKLNKSFDPAHMGWYYAVDFGPINTGDPVITGADAYREWIGHCEPYLVSIGDQLQMEPGNMVGPTAQGIADLIDLDPYAEWDPATGTVINSDYPTSPRVIKGTVFDPSVGVQTDGTGRDYLTVVKIVVLFLEEHHSDEVTGRFMRRASGGEPCPDCPPGFVFTPVLVE